MNPAYFDLYSLYVYSGNLHRYINKITIHVIKMSMVCTNADIIHEVLKHYPKKIRSLFTKRFDKYPYAGSPQTTGKTSINMCCFVVTPCRYSLNLITYTYLSNMACPDRALRWTTQCMQYTWPWGSRIDTHKWYCNAFHCDVVNRYYQPKVYRQSGSRSFIFKLLNQRFITSFN